MAWRWPGSSTRRWPTARPVCVLIARQPDRWLAHWSRAEGTLPLPVDPLTAPGVVADLLRAHARRPVVRR